MTQKPKAMPVMAENIPEELKSGKQFICWKWELIGGRWTKPLYHPRGHHAKSNDPTTWVGFDEALAACTTGKFDGIGRCFTKVDKFTAFDLDKCRLSDGSAAPWAKKIIDGLASYSEITPSSNGFRVWVKAEKPGQRSGKGNIEIYDKTSKRYLCLTGNILNGSREILPRQEVVDALYKEIFSPTIPEPPKQQNAPQNVSGLFQWDGNIDHLPISSKIRSEILNGREKGQRSEPMFSVLCALVWSNLSDPQIYEIFEAYPIGEKYREKGSNRENWLRSQIEKARAKTLDRAKPYRQPQQQEYQAPEQCTREPGDEPETEPSRRLPPSRIEMLISLDEMTTAKLTPACIVKDYLYADVASLAAPGGTGKTTQVLYEKINVALNRPVYGLDLCRPGWSLYITAEDSREILVARLREIMGGMGLTDTEKETVRNNVLIWDVTGEVRKLVEIRDGNIILTSLADDIIATHRIDPPVIITFDPSVSFGASESFVNDNEQGLITAGRRIVRNLCCCVRFISHTGKANARDKTLDQYTSRGGSALPDGTRMAAVMQSWHPDDARKLPPGLTCSPESSISILARPKLSYSPPNLPLIWIKRTGWEFEHVTEIKLSDEEREKALFDQVERFLHSEVTAGVHHNRTSLETAVPGVVRAEARRAINQLIARGRIKEAELPKHEQAKSRKTYLITSADFGRLSENGEKSQGMSAEKIAENSLPPPKGK